MTLISYRHLAGPFRNTTHLLSIVAAVFLFAIFRLSGGGTSYAPRDSGEIENVDSTQEQTYEESRGSRRENHTAGKDLVNQMLSQKEREEVRKDPSRGTGNHEPADKNAKGLDDIEKAMGLR